jgi:hypothetical protein
VFPVIAVVRVNVIAESGYVRATHLLVVSRAR